MSGIPYGVDAVDQFQVVTSGGQAELGRALGGYINVVTKSGTNTLHGDVYGYFRDDSFNAANALIGHDAADVAAAVRRAASAVRSSRTGRSTSRTSSSGGSIRPGLTTICDGNVGIINARLAAVGYPGQPVTTGIYPNPVDTHERARQDRSPVQRPRSVRACATACMTSRRATRAAPAD